MVIREFRQDDRQRVEDFFNQMGGESRAFFNSNGGNQRNAMRFFDQEEDTTGTTYFMAEEDGVMVGYVFLWDLDKGVPWLGIAVAETHKGKGLGRDLIAHAHAYARSKGKQAVLLTTHLANVRGQRLYEHMGYYRMGVHTSGEILYMKDFGYGD